MDLLELIHEDRSAATRPFSCAEHQCFKSFARRSDLVRHMRIHSNDRPFVCHYAGCSRDFIQRSALTVHIRVHTGERPHRCEYEGCPKAFSDSSSLARHRRIHTGKRPYKCLTLTCQKTFCRKTTLTKHIKKNHPGSTLGGASFGADLIPKWEDEGSDFGSPSPSTPSDSHDPDAAYIDRTPDTSPYRMYPRSHGPSYKLGLQHRSPGAHSAPGQVENSRGLRSQRARKSVEQSPYLSPPALLSRQLRDISHDSIVECNCAEYPHPHTHYPLDHPSQAHLSQFDPQFPQFSPQSQHPDSYPSPIVHINHLQQYIPAPHPQFSFSATISQHRQQQHQQQLQLQQQQQYQQQQLHGSTNFAQPYPAYDSGDFHPYTMDPNNAGIFHNRNRRASSTSALEHLSSGLVGPLLAPTSAEIAQQRRYSAEPQDYNMGQQYSGSPSIDEGYVLSHPGYFTELGGRRPSLAAGFGNLASALISDTGIGGSMGGPVGPGYRSGALGGTSFSSYVTQHIEGMQDEGLSYAQV